jgi:hypothetical protein
VGNTSFSGSSDEIKCCASAREEGTLQQFGEKVCILVCIADLSGANMSCLNLLLEILVCDVEILASFCHSVGVCDIDTSLVVDAQCNFAYVLNFFPVNDLTLWLIVETESCGAE